MWNSSPSCFSVEQDSIFGSYYYIGTFVGTIPGSLDLEGLHALYSLDIENGEDISDIEYTSCN